MAPPGPGEESPGRGRGRGRGTWKSEDGPPRNLGELPRGGESEEAGTPNPSPNPNSEGCGSLSCTKMRLPFRLHFVPLPACFRGFLIPPPGPGDPVSPAVNATSTPQPYHSTPVASHGHHVGARRAAGTTHASAERPPACHTHAAKQGG